MIKATETNDVTKVLGDFNAKVGEDTVQYYIGPYDLGQRNERGERLIEFCQSKQIITANT